MKPLSIVVTCEHGGNRVPARYRPLFAGRARLLASHAGYDRGALALARRLARALDAPLYQATVTRLLVDLNRSAPRNLFSAVTRDLPPRERSAILERFYTPYRRAVEDAIAAEIAAGRRVLHLSVHTFTPVRRGVRRRVQLGLLNDPRRRWERALAARWADALRTRWPRRQVRLNEPYRGTADGFTTHLRKRFGDADYAGLELEVNRRLADGPAARQRGIAEGLHVTLRQALG